MSDFKLFRNTVTCQTGHYPAHFENFPNMEVISPDEVVCTDCVVEDAPNLPVEVADEVPTPKKMERFKKNG